MKKLLLSLLLIISNYTSTQENICLSDEMILEQIRKEVDLSIEKRKKEDEQSDKDKRLNHSQGIENTITITQNEHPTLYKIIHDLSNKMEVKIHKIDIIFEDIQISGKYFSKNGAYSNVNTIRMGINFINNLNLNEIKAISAHEMAHIKFRHAIKLNNVGSKTRFIPSGALILTHFFARNYQFYQNHKYKILIGLDYLYGKLFILAYRKLSRAHEYEADSEAIKYVNKDDLKSALKKMSSKNNGNWFRGLWLTHPSLNQRLQYIDEQYKNDDLNCANTKKYALAN